MTIMSSEFQQYNGELPVVLGRTERDENFMFDLVKMPHLLIVGSTGMGKSVGINNIITSLLTRKKPSELQFVLIDTKMVEFGYYEPLEKCGYLTKIKSEDDAIITDYGLVAKTIQSLCIEMNNRLTRTDTARTQPRIVVVIDEFSDLMLLKKATRKEVEANIVNLATKGQEVGIHLVVATVRPDNRVISDAVKRCFTARMAFRLMSSIECERIVGTTGKELTERGDMLFFKDKKLTCVKCALIETPEIEKIIETISTRNGFPYTLPLAYDDNF